MADKKTELSPELKVQLKAGFVEEWRKEMRKSIPVKERMKMPRQKMPERQAGERNKDFEEVNLGLRAKEAVIEAKRCLDCANPQCVGGVASIRDNSNFQRRAAGFGHCCHGK